MRSAAPSRRWAAPGQIRRDERANASPPLDDAFEVKLPVRSQHGVRVDRERAHDFLHGRQLIARLEYAQPHRLPHLLHELQIRRDARALKMEFDHDPPLSS